MECVIEVEAESIKQAGRQALSEAQLDIWTEVTESSIEIVSTSKHRTGYMSGVKQHGIGE